MGAGTTFLAWVTMLASGQTAPSQPTYLNERDIEIPIMLPDDPAARASIDQLFLYVSTDGGRTWRQEAAASPGQTGFRFFAPGDGSYGFKLQIVDKRKQAYPPDVGAGPADLMVVVDQRKPLIKLQPAERQGDQVSVAWQIHDEQLDLNTLKLEYRAAENASWHPVSMNQLVASGQARWPIGTPGAIAVRIQVQDLAGNTGMAQIDVPGDASTGVALTSGLSAPPPPPLAAPPGPPSSIGKPPAAPPSPGENPFPTWKPSNGSPGYPPAAPPATETGPRIIARTDAPAAVPAPTGADPGALTPPGSTPPRPRGPSPALQYTNGTRVDLNYEISRVGPSGIGSVELWATNDDGKTWKKLAEDTDLQPPMTVDLPGEDVYGFTLIIRSRAGLGRANPQPGEAPQMRLEVDTAAPSAVLYAVEADPRPEKRNTLHLLWNATDRNLANNPISLKWSERPDGEWQTIAAEIPNTGRYAWQMPANLPFKVYLRIEVSDLAGNVNQAQTPEPVLVDLTEPEGGITGLAPSGRK